MICTIEALRAMERLEVVLDAPVIELEPAC
jgi:hypothetical protein